MWKKYLWIPTVLSALSLALLMEQGLCREYLTYCQMEGLHPQSLLVKLPLFLPMSLCSNLFLYIVLAIVLLFSCTQMNIEDDLKQQRIMLGGCLAAVVLSYLLAAWASNVCSNLGLIFLAVINLMSSISAWPISVGAVALLISFILLLSRILRTIPPKKPWER